MNIYKIDISIFMNNVEIRNLSKNYNRLATRF